MPRPHLPALILAAALAASPALAHDQDGTVYRSRRARDEQPPQPTPMVIAEDHDLRVYDLRDLAATLPPQRDGAPAADTLVATLTAALGVQHRRLLDGVYAVAAPPDTHTLLQQNLERIRQLHGESYQLTVAAYAVDAAAAPAVGDRADLAADAPLLARVSSSVPRRSPTSLLSTREVGYIADWTPVVGDSAVGYDATTSSQTEGLSLVATIGAQDGADGGEFLQLSGDLRRVELRHLSAPALNPGGSAHDATLPIALPTVDTRHVRAELRIQPGRPTVVAVLGGFSPDQAIVLTATVAPPAPAPAAAPTPPRR